MTKEKYRSVLEEEIERLHAGAVCGFSEGRGHGETLHDEIENHDGYFHMDISRRTATVTEWRYDESNFEFVAGAATFSLKKGERSVVRNAMHRCRHDVWRRSKAVPHMNYDDHAKRAVVEKVLYDYDLVVEVLSDKLVKGYLCDGSTGRRLDEIAMELIYGGTWEVTIYDRLKPFDYGDFPQSHACTVTSNFLNYCVIQNEQGDSLFFSKKGVAIRTR